MTEALDPAGSRRPAPGGPATLSVVVIGRNEAATIGRLVESVLAETAPFPRDKVVVVDSASTDGMADVAARYPVEVVRLLPGQPLTAAAGRNVGVSRTSGELVLFLDGDMELHPGWLAAAMSLLERRDDVAGCTGTLIERPEMPGPAGPPPSPGRGPVRWTEVRFLGGAALYRRGVLVGVGGFRPFVRSDEEPELCLRIRRSGRTLLESDHPVAFHYTAPGDSIATVVGRWRRGLYLGAGQNLRHLAGTPLLVPYLRERGFGIVPLAAITAGLACATASLAGHRRWLRGYGALVGGFVVADVARRRGDLHGTARAMVQRLAIADGTVRGFLLARRDPGEHPARLEVVREAPPGAAAPLVSTAPCRSGPPPGTAG